jgi:NADH-quinone oxidoreductase subunit A
MPIMIHILAVAGLAGVIILMSALFGPNKPSADKLDVYECGVPPLAGSRVRMSIKFYVIAVLFVLFDVEVIFMYPWAIIFKRFLAQAPVAIALSMGFFLFILVVGLLFEWKRGALEWD